MKSDKCAACYWWSEMIVIATAAGPITAMCLNKDSDHYNGMTSIRNTCDSFEDGHGASVDSL